MKNYSVSGKTIENIRNSLQNRCCFWVFFRRAEVSARRAQNVSHARREGHEKNNACPHTIVHAVPAFKYERGYPIGYLMHVIMGCFSTKICWSRHCVLLAKLLEKPFVFSKCGKEKEKKCVGLLLKWKGVVGMLSIGYGKSLIWQSFPFLHFFCTKQNALRVFLAACCSNILAIKSTNLAPFWMTHDVHKRK